MMLQYLQSRDKHPLREFKNTVGVCGFGHNLTESTYALLGIDGFEVQVDKSFSGENQNIERQPLNEQI